MGERQRCLVCNRGVDGCFCGFVEPFETRTRFAVLMHPKEFKRQTTGTGRLTGRALRRSEVIMGGDFDDNVRVRALLDNPKIFPVMLYPGRGAVDLSSDDSFSIPEGRELLVLVIDGTWRHARKMLNRSACLQNIPRISFRVTHPSRFRIKRQPAEYCVSTIEAVYGLLCELDRRGLESLDGAHRTLISAIDKLVAWQQSYIDEGAGSSRHGTGPGRVKKTTPAAVALRSAPIPAP